MNFKVSLDNLIARTLNGRVVEPIKRIKCLGHVPRGLRNRPEPPRWMAHTYPIKGGKTRMQTMISENLTKNNALFKRLTLDR